MSSLKFIFDFDTWQEIFGSIAKNKTRTIITVIGVLWGIFIYITLSGSAKGLDNGFEREFKDMAMNSMFVWPQRTSIPYAGFMVGRYPRFTISNVKELATPARLKSLLRSRYSNSNFGQRIVSRGVIFNASIFIVLLL